MAGSTQTPSASRHSMLEILDSATVASADAVNRTAGASPESGHPPVPAGFDAISPPRKDIVTNHDPNGLIATATPSTPASDLIRILNDTGEIHHELQQEVTRLGRRNDWLEVRNHWLEECSKLGSAELDRLQGIIRHGIQQISYANNDIAELKKEIARQTKIARQCEKELSEFRSSTNEAAADLPTRVNNVQKNVDGVQEVRREGEDEMEKDDEEVVEEAAPVAAKLKIKGPAPRAPKHKRRSDDELEAASLGGPKTRAGKLQRGKKPNPRLARDKPARLEQHPAVDGELPGFRDPTPDGYSKV